MARDSSYRRRREGGCEVVPDESPEELVEPSEEDASPSVFEAVEAVGDSAEPSPLDVVVVGAPTTVVTPAVGVGSCDAGGVEVSPEASSSAGPAEPPVDSVSVAVPAPVAGVEWRKC